MDTQLSKPGRAPSTAEGQTIPYETNYTWSVMYANGSSCPVCGHRFRWIYRLTRTDDNSAVASTLICPRCSAHPGCSPRNPGHEICRIQGYCQASAHLQSTHDILSTDRVVKAIFKSLGFSISEEADP